MIRFHRPDPVSGSEHSDQAPRRPQHRRRSLSLRLLGFAVALVVCLLAAGYPPFTGGTGVARADQTFPPADLLNFSLLNSCGGPVAVGATASSLYCATADQIQSLKNLQQAAISKTISDYHLDPSDANAVQSWGRDEALGALWGLLTTAITTPACSTGKTPCRTTDQQNAVDWLDAIFKRQAIVAAEDAGLEYAKWAGLDPKYYQSLLSSGASESTLETFLNGAPVTYNLIDSSGSPISAGGPNNFDGTAASKSTGGYCVYRSPPPYASEYDANVFQGGSITSTTPPECSAGSCANLLGCTPPTPSYDQFTKWGQADVSNQYFSSSDFVTTAFRISSGLLGTFALEAAVTGFIPQLGATVITYAPEVTYIATRTALQTAEGVADSAELIGGGEITGISLSAGAVLTVVAIVVEAIIIAVLHGIQVVSAAALPGKLATLITNAQTAAPTDLNAVLTDNSQAPGLYDLFIGATLPSPKNSTCDNNQIALTTIPTPCLNPTPIPDATLSDPNFAIQAQGSTTTTYANSLTWKDTVTNRINSARLHETWFIEQQTPTGGSTTTPFQALHIHYTDWSGNGQTASLVNDPGKGYMFASIPDSSTGKSSFNPSTCGPDNTCSYSPTIQYVGTDGNKYTAKVAPTVPQVSPFWNAHPVEGSPVTFHANGSSPVGSSLTYQWAFEMPIPPGSSTCISGLGNTCSTTVSASGDPVSNTWTTSGTFQVTLTATDAQGRQTVDTFPVLIRDVPPTLSLAPACPDASPCDVRSGPPGSTTTLTGSITHAGSADTETVDINWGDGTGDNITTVPQSGLVICANGVCPTPNPTITQASGTLDTFSGAHAYATAGSYRVAVTVTDQGGGIVTKITTEQVQYVTQVSWPTPPPITYGTPLGAAQLDAAASATAAASVPGTFAYQVDGTPVTASDNTVLAAGPHTLSVQFTPTDTTTYTTPAAVTVPLMVNQAPLTITAGSPSMIYNTTVPAISPGYSGFVNNEGASVLTPAPSCTSTAPSSGAVGSYTTSCTGAVDPNYSFSYLPGLLTISKAATSLSLGTSGNPVMHGNSVTFTATVAVTAPGAGTPTGTVTFSDGGTVLGTGQLGVVGGTDQATFTTSSLALGPHTITASYGGDGNFTGTGPTSTLTQNIDTNISGYPTLPNGAYNLSNTNLAGAYLADLSLVGATLTGSNLKGATFTGADLTGANLSNSNLKGANFTGVTLSGANLTNSNLMGATGLKTATLTNVIWSNTACPDGSNSSSDGGTCVGHL
jgi:hypothetical protein